MFVLYSLVEWNKTVFIYCKFGKRDKMFGNAIRYFSTKPKPKMKPIELKTPPEQTQTITRVIFDILKEHGPLTVGDTWERVKVRCVVLIDNVLDKLTIARNRLCLASIFTHSCT